MSLKSHIHDTQSIENTTIRRRRKDQHQQALGLKVT
jgi:hypothetical protein